MTNSKVSVRAKDIDLIVYDLLRQISRREIEDLFSEKDPQSVDFKPFG